jgi:hypothetical protein
MMITDTHCEMIVLSDLLCEVTYEANYFREQESKPWNLKTEDSVPT